MKREKAVLAYSGGLDTSVILYYTVHEKGYNVVAYTANVGQLDFDPKKIIEKAMNTGASDAFVEDVREEFVTDYVFPAIRANAKYEGRYLLGTSVARPLTAKKQVEYAKRVGAEIVSHGATGKGNDQVRFENVYIQMFLECKIYSPWRDDEFKLRFPLGRDSLMEYAYKHGIPISQSKKEPWSSDDNLMHISYEAGMLENPMQRPREDMFKMTVSPEEAPDEETILEIEFEKGNPVLVRNLNDGTVKNNPLDLFIYLNEVAGKNGVGRVDMVESRFVGMKSRGVYETPGATVLHAAHRDLEGITMDREVTLLRDGLIPKYSERIYSGHWFAPETELLREFMDLTQKYVSGEVKVKLYKGNVESIGRSSPYSLYDENIASMHMEGDYNPEDATGFIKINALRLKINERRKKIGKQL
jgi:argininosuccinate synthase